MSKQINNTAKSLRKYAIGCAICNSIWAGAIATLYAVVAHALLANPHTNVSLGEAIAATIFTWVVTFGIAFVQGAIFIAIFSVLAAGVYYLFFANKHQGGDSTPTGETADNK